MKNRKIFFVMILGLGLQMSGIAYPAGAEEARPTVTADKTSQAVPIGAKRDREMNKSKFEAKEKRQKQMHEKMEEKIQKMKIEKPARHSGD